MGVGGWGVRGGGASSPLEFVRLSLPFLALVQQPRTMDRPVPEGAVAGETERRGHGAGHGRFEINDARIRGVAALALLLLLPPLLLAALGRDHGFRPAGRRHVERAPLCRGGRGCGGEEGGEGWRRGWDPRSCRSWDWRNARC